MSFIMSDVIVRVPMEDDLSVTERGGKGALRKLLHPLCVGQRDSEAWLCLVTLNLYLAPFVDYRYCSCV